MDNLIRTYNYMPIIQVDYTNAQGMVTVIGERAAEFLGYGY
jgi:hypothetical protein